MRSRFFLTILGVLLVVTTGSVFLYSLFLRQERLSLIDQQVRETAAALVDSQLGDLRKIDFDEADEIISEELGESRIGKFFIIKNAHGQTVFESASAQLLPVAVIPGDRQWFEISANGRFVRGLNLKLPRFPDRTLQVGLVLDEQLVKPSYFSQASVTFFAAVLVLGLIVSFLSTSFLLRPIAVLDDFLSEVTSASKIKTLLPSVPLNVSKDASMKSRDEFKRVLAGLNLLITQVNKNYQFSRLWGYQMAHELKTPLSLVQMEIERLQKRHQLSDNDIEDLTRETTKITSTINSFLGWAELENSSQHRHLFLNQITETVEEVVRLAPSHNIKIGFLAQEPFCVAANPAHLEQLIQNLIYNAIKHAGPGCEISIRTYKNTLEIQDNGSGIPKEVMERLGEPFNRGAEASRKSQGHGLGLAWVKSICRHYDWSIEFDTKSIGTRVFVTFPATSS